MADISNADGPSGGSDLVGRLGQMGNRTSLMVIDATVRALPKEELGLADAAAEVRTLARRMNQATRDFRASLEFSGVVDTTLAG